LYKPHITVGAVTVEADTTLAPAYSAAFGTPVWYMPCREMCPSNKKDSVVVMFPTAKTVFGCDTVKPAAVPRN
jgi:hypothetical protein